MNDLFYFSIYSAPPETFGEGRITAGVTNRQADAEELRGRHVSADPHSTREESDLQTETCTRISVQDQDSSDSPRASFWNIGDWAFQMT